MNILARLFWLPFNKRVVDRCILPDLSKSLEDFLKARGISSSFLSDSLVTDLLNVAYERARAQEHDHCARYGAMWQQMEQIAEQAAHIHKGAKGIDERVEAILRMHRA